MKVGILGYGEIGKAVKKLYGLHQVFIRDLDRDDGIENCRYLHVCIPYSKNFVNQVSEIIEANNPSYVIIHSTVQPTTTEKIVERTRAKVVHSPVRGIHPELLEGLLTFEKYVGADFDCEEVIEHLNSLGIKTKLVSSRTSELAKLLSTTYYGLCIAWHGEMQKMCDELNVDFEEVTTDWNNGYNEGYLKLDMAHVVRPVLYPPTRIGGHCVLENTEILKQSFESEALDLILKYK